MNSLPDLVILHILSFLPLIDRKATRLVCKRLLALNKSKFLVMKDVLVVDNYQKIHKYVSPNIRHVANVRVDLTNCPDPDDQRPPVFWQTYKEDIKAVTIILREVCNNTIRPIMDIFLHCGKLECFTVICIGREEDCNHLQTISDEGEIDEPIFCSDSHGMSINAERLKHLKFFCCPCPRLFSALTKNACNLQTLYVHGSCDLNHYGRSDYLLNFFKKHKSQLKEISFVVRRVDTYTGNLIKHMGSSVNELSILLGVDFDDSVLLNITEKLSSLKTFCWRPLFNGDANYRPNLLPPLLQFTENALVHLVTNVTTLTHISLMDADVAVSDNTAAALSQLPNLTCLDVTDCQKLTSNGVKLLFGQKPSHKIIDLKLSGIKNLTDDCIVAISPNLPNLQFLDISGCDKLTSASYQAIFQNNQRLQCLSMNVLGACNEEGRSINSLQHLAHIALYIDHEVGPDMSEATATELTLQLMLSLKLRFLRSLAVNGDVLISLTPAVLEPVFINCPYLKYIASQISENSRFNPLLPFPVEVVNRELKRQRVMEWFSHGWCELPIYSKLSPFAEELQSAIDELSNNN